MYEIIRLVQDFINQLILFFIKLLTLERLRTIDSKSMFHTYDKWPEIAKQNYANNFSNIYVSSNKQNIGITDIQKDIFNLSKNYEI